MIVRDWSQYAPYFTEGEFKCSHTGMCEMQSEFMDILFKIRKEFNKPIKITSGYRDWTHPVEMAKGHKGGEHTKGLCADIGISGPDVFEFIRIAIKYGIVRLGVSQKGTSRFLHIGLGGEGLPTPAVWSY